MLFAIWTWVPPLVNVVVLILGIFLILLVLIQRGKGGGLAGAFGGVGGSSAFGSRAGDLFTRITGGVFLGWVLLIMIQVGIMQQASAQVQEESNVQGAATESPEGAPGNQPGTPGNAPAEAPPGP